MPYNKSFEFAPSGPDAQETRAAQFRRVCRAWRKTREVEVLLPGHRRAEG